LENLGIYISDLLSEHDCVIVPGFGGFVARPAPAHFSKTGNILLPPGKSLVFNKNLANSDGLLANYLMQKLSVSYREANNLLDKWVLQSKTQLETQKRLELERTGILYYNPENTLLFEPAASSNHQVSSFGLMAVKAVALDIEKNKTTESKKEIIYREAVPKSTGNRTLMRISVIVSSVLLFSFLILVTARQLPISKALASLNPFAKKEAGYNIKPYNFSKLLSEHAEKALPELKNSLTLKLANNSSKVFVIASDTIEIDKTKVIKSVNHFQTGNANFNSPFQIVVGCFAIEQNAYKLIHQLEKENITSGISGKTAKGLNIVSVAGFSTESMARTKLQQVRQKFPSAWILVK
jgi:hypothetical protein